MSMRELHPREGSRNECMLLACYMLIVDILLKSRPISAYAV